MTGLTMPTTTVVDKSINTKTDKTIFFINNPDVRCALGSDAPPKKSASASVLSPLPKGYVGSVLKFYPFNSTFEDINGKIDRTLKITKKSTRTKFRNSH